MHTIGEALELAQATGYGRRTGSKVWADSKVEIGQEGRHWRPFNKAHAGKVIAAAEKYDRIARLRHRRDKTGRENGALGHIGLDVLRYLLSVIDHKTGALYPAVKTIADACGRSTAAVHDALKRLRAHGFLTWVRRFARTGRAGLRGPQVKQATNAYAIMLPVAIAAGMAAAPPPDDDSHRRATVAQEREDMEFGTTGLAAALASLGQSLMMSERDSGRQNESHLR